jgi:putative DNA primase/helicase
MMARVRVIRDDIDFNPLGLDLNKDGCPRTSIANVMTVLASDPAWEGVIAFNAFSEEPVILRQPPQRVQDEVSIAPGSPWTPQDSTRAATWIAERHRFNPPSKLVTEAMLALAQQNTFHPVRAYLDGLKWDGNDRLDTFFANYCGASPSAYSRGVARMLFISAIARVRKPGAKVDTIVVLEGAQGLGKSGVLSALSSPWFADTPINLGDKDAYQSLRGVWLYELAELASLKGRDATRIKSFASSPADHYRPSYEARARTVPRQCIFAATTNESEYLSDATGSRRFWPQPVGKIDLPAIRRDRDQLWAEADKLFREGATWWPDASLDVLGTEEQSKRFEGDPWEERIAAWLANPTRKDRDERGHLFEDRMDPTVGFTMAEILEHAVGMPAERQDKRAQARASDVLRVTGWSRGPARRESGIRVRRWIRGGEAGVVTGAGDGGDDK